VAKDPAKLMEYLGLKKPDPICKEPKVLLVDIPADAAKQVRSLGYEVSEGSFGTPYTCPYESAPGRVELACTVPRNVVDHKIILVDLQAPATVDGGERFRQRSPGEKGWWTSREHGFIDPRLPAMKAVAADFGKALRGGGLLVVFAEPLTTCSYSNATFALSHKFQDGIDSWAFLPGNDRLVKTESEHGTQMTVVGDQVGSPLVLRQPSIRG